MEAAQTLGQGIVPLISGYPGAERSTVMPSPSPLQTGLSAGATLAGIYRLFKGNMSITLKRPMFRKGGEVNEGIMDLAQPRKNYDKGTTEEQIKEIFDVFFNTIR